MIVVFDVSVFAALIENVKVVLDFLFTYYDFSVEIPLLH